MIADGSFDTVSASDRPCCHILRSASLSASRMYSRPFSEPRTKAKRPAVDVAASFVAPETANEPRGRGLFSST